MSLFGFELSSLFDKSVFIEYWRYIFSVLVALYVLISFYDKHLYGGNNKRKQSENKPVKREALEGEEYVGEINSEYNNDDDFQPVLEEKEHIPFKGATIKLHEDPLKAATTFYAIVNNRRSVRKYSSKNVDYKVIEKCILAAGTGPSGAHTEPWSFCVISDPSVKSQVREIIEIEEYKNYTQRMSKQWTTDLKPLKTDYVKEYLTEAPYLILIFKQTYGFKEDGSKKQHYYNEISTSISTGILLCALQSAGLNSLITTPLNCGPALRLLLNRPNNEKLLVLLPVGYAADDCLVPDLQRKSIDEILVKY